MGCQISECTEWAVLVGGVGELAGRCDGCVEFENEHRLDVVLLVNVVVFFERLRHSQQLPERLRHSQQSTPPYSIRWVLAHKTF